MRSPPTGDTQKAQSGRALVSDAKICPAPLPQRFPPPSWYQTAGKEEPKSRCRQQNALESQVQISFRCFGLCNPPRHLPAEAKGIAGINNATVSAIKRRMEATEAVPISTHRSLVARAGLASAGSRLRRGNKKQNNTNLVRSYGLRFGGEGKKKKKRCWKAHLGNLGSGILCRASESVTLLCKIFTSRKDVFSLPPRVNTGYLS